MVMAWVGQNFNLMGLWFGFGRLLKPLKDEFSINAMYTVAVILYRKYGRLVLPQMGAANPTHGACSPLPQPQVLPQKAARVLSNRQALIGLNEAAVELRCAA